MKTFRVVNEKGEEVKDDFDYASSEQYGLLIRRRKNSPKYQMWDECPRGYKAVWYEPIDSITVPNGLTVAALKKLIQSWPETNHLGEPTEVWIETGKNLSSPVTYAGPLNYRRDDDGKPVADLILESTAFDV